jgi:hypothetical protein
MAVLKPSDIVLMNSNHSTPVRKRPKKRKAVIRDEDEGGEEGSNESFEVVSNKDAFNSDDEVF